MTIRRAIDTDRTPAGLLWLDFLQEQGRLDRRVTPAEDVLSRWQNDFSVWIKAETKRIYVAETGGRLVGFVSAHTLTPPPIYIESLEAYIEAIYVDPEMRGRRIGTGLVNRVKEWARSVGADRLRMSVLTSNEKGMGFWKELDTEPFYTSMTIELEEKPPGRGRKESQAFGFNWTAG